MRKRSPPWKVKIAFGIERMTTFNGDRSAEYSRLMESCNR